MIKDKNFSRGLLSNFSPEDGDTIVGCNFMQLAPHTEITTVKNLTFINCNLINCDVDAPIYGCNMMQISRCAHIHGTDEYSCITECSHMTSKEEIVLDGEVVDTIYEYEDKAVS